MSIETQIWQLDSYIHYGVNKLSYYAETYGRLPSIEVKTIVMEQTEADSTNNKPIRIIVLIQHHHRRITDYKFLRKDFQLEEMIHPYGAVEIAYVQMVSRLKAPHFLGVYVLDLVPKAGTTWEAGQYVAHLLVTHPEELGQDLSITYEHVIHEQKYSMGRSALFSFNVKKGLTMEPIVAAGLTAITSLSSSISPTNTLLKLGQSQLFTLTASGGTPPYHYGWIVDGIVQTDATASTWTFTPTRIGTVTITADVGDVAGAHSYHTATVTVYKPPEQPVPFQ